MSYIGRAPTYGLFEKQNFVGNSSTTTFTLNYPVSSSGGILTVKNGTVLEPNIGYAVSYDQITFAAAPAVSDSVYVVYLGRSTVTPYAVGKQITRDAFTGDGATVNFTTTGTVILPASLLVFVDGVQQSNPGNYTTAGAIVTFTSAPPLSAQIEVVNLGTEATSYLTPADQSINWSKLNPAIAGSSGQWSIITGNTTAVNGTWYMCDTTSNTISLTLPASPTIGTVFRVLDIASTFDTNALTILRNGKKIMGLSQDMTVTTENAGFGLIWTNDTYGWRILDV